MKKYMLLAFLLILSSLFGCAKQGNPTAPQANEQIQITSDVEVSTEVETEEPAVTNSDMPQKTDTEYEQLLNEYNGILLKYSETSVHEQFFYLEDEAMGKFQTLLSYRESLLEEYPSGYELYFDVPKTRIRFSEIYKNNDDNYRYVTYIPTVSNTSKVFIQVWNDDLFESAELLAVEQSPKEEYEVIDTRILSDDSGVYANILIKATDIAFWEDSYGMCTYKIENGTCTNFIPIKGNISAGNWTVEENSPFDINVTTNLMIVEIKCNKEKETGEWFKAGYGFEGNVLTFFEVGGGNEFQLVFENGIWKEF